MSSLFQIYINNKYLYFSTNIVKMDAKLHDRVKLWTKYRQFFNNILTKYKQHFDKIHVQQNAKLYNAIVSSTLTQISTIGLELYSFGLYTLGIPPSKNWFLTSIAPNQVSVFKVSDIMPIISFFSPVGKILMITNNQQRKIFATTNG